jgi:hypothetical protein
MAFHTPTKPKPKPRSLILLLSLAIAAIALLFLFSSLISTNGFSTLTVFLKNRGNRLQLQQLEPRERTHTGHEKYLYWASRIVESTVPKSLGRSQRFRKWGDTPEKFRITGLVKLPKPENCLLFIKQHVNEF